MAVTEHISKSARSQHTGAIGSFAPKATGILANLPLPVILYLLTVVVPIGFYAGPLFITTLRLLLLVMTIPLMLKVLMGHYGKVYLTDLLFVCHILWAAVSLTINNPSQMVEQVGSVGMELLGGYAIGRAFIRSQEQFIALCKALAIIVIFTFPFAIYEALTGHTIIIEFLRDLPGVTSVGIVRSDPRLGLERVQAVFAHAIHYGLFCSIALSLCFVGLKGTISTWKRFLMSIAIMASGFLALSSGALTAVAMQLAFILWFSIFRGFKQRWWLLVGLFILAYVTVDLLSNRSPLKVFMSYATFSAHNAYWRSIIFDWGLANIIGSTEKGIVGSPFIGIGLRDWVRPYYMYSGSMDNFWLVIGVRYGLPGLLLLAIGYFSVIFQVMRKNFDADENLLLLRRSWVFTFLGLTFTLCTVHVWTNIYSFIFFMFGTGLWFITATPNSTQETPETDEKQNGGSHSRFTRFPAASPEGELVESATHTRTRQLPINRTSGRSS